MTRKLYYEDAYLKEWDALVVSCEAAGDFYDVVLDSTAFFPEAGGQYADRGVIASARVVDVKEIDGVIHHTAKSALTAGQRVHCALDFDERMFKMRYHTAEHILSGIIHSLYGYNNVGFHLGHELVTFDIDKPLSREQLCRVELLANAAVQANVAVTAEIVSEDILPSLTYRSKTELYENVRIVTVGDYDCCACCAPHVSHTGEIGLIKICEAEHLRAGVRIYFKVATDALIDYQMRYDTVQSISAMLSATHAECAAAVGRVLGENESLRLELKGARCALAREYAAALELTEGNRVCYYPTFTAEQMREFANCAMEKTGGFVVVLCGDDGNLKYVVANKNGGVDTAIKAINSALCGKGGGRGTMASGSLAACVDEVRRYFEV